MCAGCQGGRLDSNHQRGPEEHQDWAAGGAREAHQIPVLKGQGHPQSSLTTRHEVKALIAAQQIWMQWSPNTQNLTCTQVG